MRPRVWFFESISNFYKFILIISLSKNKSCRILDLSGEVKYAHSKSVYFHLPLSISSDADTRFYYNTNIFYICMRASVRVCVCVRVCVSQ